VILFFATSIFFGSFFSSLVPICEYEGRFFRRHFYKNGKMGSTELKLLLQRELLIVIQGTQQGFLLLNNLMKLVSCPGNQFMNKKIRVNHPDNLPACRIREWQMFIDIAAVP